MSTIKLRIDSDETYFLDTYLNEDISIDIRVQDLAQIQSAQGVITKETFRIPLQGSAIDLFGDLSDLTQEAKVDIRKSLKGAIIINGFPQYEGRFNVIKIYDNPKEIELVFQGNATSLKARLSVIFLKDLLSDETVPYNITEIANYHNDPQGELLANGYGYPLVDYGQNFTGDDTATGRRKVGISAEPLTQADFKPEITKKKILDVLAEEEGIVITYDSDLSDLVYQTILLHNNDTSIPTLDTSELDYTGYMEASVSQGGSFAGPATNTYKVLFDTKAVYDTANAGIFDLTNEEYTATFGGEYTVKLFSRVGISLAAGAANVTVKHYLYVNGVQHSLLGVREYGADTTLRTQQLLTTRKYTFNTGDLISVHIEVDTGSAVTVNYSFNKTTRFTVLAAPAVTSLSNVLVGQSIPQELTAWDVVKTLVAQTNGIVETVSYDEYNINYWNEWIEEGEVLILDNKKVDGKSVRIEPTSTTGAKRIELAYQEDEDLYNEAYKKLEGEVYGSLIIDDTGSDFSTKTVKIDIPFAATPIAPIEATTLEIPKLHDSSFETIKGKPRLLFSVDGKQYDYSLYLQDIAGGAVTETDHTAYRGHWGDFAGGYLAFDTNFGTSLTFYASEGYPSNNLYTLYWKRYIEETYGANARKVTLDVQMTPYEISQLTMNEKVFYNNNLYRFTEINNISLNNNTPQTVTLAFRKPIENIDIAPFYPFDIVESVVQWKQSSDGVSVGDGSAEPAADVEESANAYGYYYDSAQNIATQSGQILIV